MTAPTAVRPKGASPAVAPLVESPDPPAPERPQPSRVWRPEERLALPILALVIAACLPLMRVFVGLDFLRPVLAAALLSVGVSWVARRLSAGPVLSFLGGLVAWFWFTSLVFLPATLWGGVLPTAESVRAAYDLWILGIELIRVAPAPTFAEPGMLFVTATGVWWVTHAVDALVFRLQAPLRAIGMALVLWVVPLAMQRGGAIVWLWALPFMVASGWLLHAVGASDIRSWGVLARTRGAPERPRRSGGAIGVIAIVLGALLAGFLPGYGDPPYYSIHRLGGGTTITTNPIVSIRSNLVTQSPTPVAHVVSPQPVYLRLTALDLYDEREQWTRSGIRSSRASGTLPRETRLGATREMTVQVDPLGLDRATFVPVPYHPVRLSGGPSGGFQFDRDGATVTVDPDQGLPRDTRYEVVAAIPDPDPEALHTATTGDVDPHLVALPDSVPREVAELAERIVADAGADTPFAKALAIQNELRTWTYSLEPPGGHSGSALRAFLEHRIGYCEQYAGTMAIMLRTLGIPARVAVGFTPGQLIEEGEETSRFLVTYANAHAWVEVLFPGEGWIAFEPTPRDDGNLLTPSATNLAPGDTDAVRMIDDTDLFMFSDPTVLPPGMAPPGSEFELDGQAPSGDGSAPEGSRLPWIAVLAGVAAAALVFGVRRKATAAEEIELSPSEAVIRQVNRVRRLGHGLREPARPWETDREYLDRLGGDLRAGSRLADAAERARYAAAVPSSDARAAREAAGAIITALLTDRPRWRRALIRVRGSVGDRLAARRRASRRRDAEEAAQAEERLRRLVRERSGR